MSFKKIVSSKLGVSEPHPRGFGNPANASSPHWSNKNWLRSLFHFSFAEYHNTRNTGFGVLRVMNDDLVQPSRGFGEHPHGDMEICTFVVHGHLSHADSMGTEETLGRGAVQYMTAGSGVYHSEHNRSATEPLRFIQIWIHPRARGLTPNYGSVTGTADGRRNRFDHLISDAAGGSVTPIKINQDANIFVAEIEPGQEASLDIASGRQAYVLNIEGDTAFSTSAHSASPTTLAPHDAAEVVGPLPLAVRAGGAAASLVLVVEMKHAPGSGRGDL
jgi:redox-sensitive bicupin YhaK (pirin superfamily)